MGYAAHFLRQADYQRRRRFVEELNEIVRGIHESISGGREQLTLTYEPDIEEAFFEDELNRAKEKDRKYCSTSVGPHRDDISFFIGDIDIRNSVPRDNRELLLYH